MPDKCRTILFSTYCQIDPYTSYFLFHLKTIGTLHTVILLLATDKFFLENFSLCVEDSRLLFILVIINLLPLEIIWKVYYLNKRSEKLKNWIFSIVFQGGRMNCSSRACPVNCSVEANSECCKICSGKLLDYK